MIVSTRLVLPVLVSPLETLPVMLFPEEDSLTVEVSVSTAVTVSV